MHVIRVVPAVDGTLLGRPVKAGDLSTLAGALPVSTPEGDNDGTRWVLTQMGTPEGIAASRSGVLYYADGARNVVRAISSGEGTQ